MAVKILVFAGSIRTGAYSGKTADAATKELLEQGADVTRISLADYPLPIMDQDLEKEKGVPENAYRFGRLIAANDGLLICSPEYNSSIPPLLKNTIDWVSRIRKDNGRLFKPFDGQGRRALLVIGRKFCRYSRSLPPAFRADELSGGDHLAAMFGRPRERGFR